MSQLEYNLMQKQLEAQNRTNELLQEIIALLNMKELQQPIKEVVSNKPQSRGKNNEHRKPRATPNGKPNQNGNK